MFMFSPSHPETVILAVPHKHEGSGCCKPSSGRLWIAALSLGRALKRIGGMAPEMALHRTISLGPVSFSQAFLFALLLLPGIACHAETSMIGTITPAELARRLKETNPPVVIDVRTRDEYAAGHIDTALNLPHDELELRLGEIPGNKSGEIVVYCRSGKRARMAEELLIKKGYKNVKDLAGHWQEWSSQAK